LFVFGCLLFIISFLFVFFSPCSLLLAICSVIMQKIKNSSGGFTLAELLIAAFLGVIVISAFGFGLVAIMTADADSETKTERRIELNRAIDYISEEIRMANSIDRVENSSIFPGSGKGVLLLNIPSDNANPNRVYFIRSSTPTWIGPNTINRASGTYQNPVTISTPQEALVLVDGIIAPQTSDLPFCSTGLQGANGFYACISSDRRIVEIYLYGRLKNSSDPYIQVSSRVFARSQL
jgi:hypothetical protein